MAFENIKAEIMLLLDAMNERKPDVHEDYERIRLSLDTMRAEGLPLPEDLVRLEQQLEKMFAAQRR